MKKKFIFWTFLLCLSCIQLFSQQQKVGFLPNEQENEYLMNLGKTFAKIFNTPDEELANKYAFETYIPEKAEGLAALLREGFGEIEIGRIRIMGNGGSIHLIAKIKETGEWHNFQIGLTQESPKKGTRLFIASSVAPVVIPKGKMEDESVLQQLKAYVLKLSLEEDLSGSLLIAKDHQVLMKQAFGLANIEEDIKNTLSTPMNMGSGNKMFTAIAIAQLVEAGKLSFQDPVGKYLSNYPDKAFAQSATIHHLLSHTSGLTDYWDDEYEKHWNDISSLEEVIPFIVNKEKAFSPGQGAAYSNSGFVLLGLIIERLSGMPYTDYVQKYIIDKIGMNNTGFYRMDGSEKPIAFGYERKDTSWTIARHGNHGGPAGGAYTTPDDMFIFAKALKNHQLINLTYTKELMSKKSQLSFGNTYGYGFLLNEGSIGHGGMGPGIYFDFRLYPETDYLFTLCLNNEGAAGAELLFTILEILNRSKN